MPDSQQGANADSAPRRGALHEALSMFLGGWEGEGARYKRPDQSEADPRKQPAPWHAVWTCRWQMGEFFLVQEEQASVAGRTFDALSVMGVDPATGQYFAHRFDSHGVERRYAVEADGAVWRLSGERERARIEFSQDARTQTISWEWRPKNAWLPLCDQVATRRVIDEARP